jgi:peptide deformylase
MVLKVLKYPDSLLRKKCLPVDKISKEVYTLVDDMIETMLKEDGLGLAANQVGSLSRIIVINTTSHEDKPEPIAMINPVILNQEGSTIEEEGCLSFPELYLKINRPERVRVHAKNLYNEDLVYETDGIMARAIFHEIDHLNGILFIDHVMKSEEEKINRYLDTLGSPLREK